MEEEEIIEKVKIAGRVFIPEDSLPTPEEKYNEIVSIKKQAINYYIQEQEYKKKELLKKMNRCKVCKCYCGAHPCKHTKYPPTE